MTASHARHHSPHVSLGRTAPLLPLTGRTTRAPHALARELQRISTHNPAAIPADQRTEALAWTVARLDHVHFPDAHRQWMPGRRLELGSLRYQVSPTATPAANKYPEALERHEIKCKLEAEMVALPAVEELLDRADQPAARRDRIEIRDCLGGARRALHDGPEARADCSRGQSGDLVKTDLLTELELVADSQVGRQQPKSVEFRSGFSRECNRLEVPAHEKPGYSATRSTLLAVNA